MLTLKKELVSQKARELPMLKDTGGIFYSQYFQLKDLRAAANQIRQYSDFVTTFRFYNKPWFVVI